MFQLKSFLFYLTSIFNNFYKRPLLLSNKHPLKKSKNLISAYSNHYSMYIYNINKFNTPYFEDFLPHATFSVHPSYFGFYMPAIADIKFAHTVSEIYSTKNSFLCIPLMATNARYIFKHLHLKLVAILLEQDQRNNIVRILRKYNKNISKVLKKIKSQFTCNNFFLTRLLLYTKIIIIQHIP